MLCSAAINYVNLFRAVLSVPCENLKENVAVYGMLRDCVLGFYALSLKLLFMKTDVSNDAQRSIKKLAISQ